MSAELDHPRHDQVFEHRLLKHLVPGILEGQFESRVDPPHGQISVPDVLAAEADDRDVVTPSVCAGQFPGEIFDVDPCAPIHVRRVLIGQDCYPHTRPPGSAKTPTLCVRDPATDRLWVPIVRAYPIPSFGARGPGVNKPNAALRPRQPARMTGRRSSTAKRAAMARPQSVANRLQAKPLRRECRQDRRGCLPGVGVGSAEGCSNRRENSARSRAVQLRCPRMSGTSAEICAGWSTYAAAPEGVSLGKCFSPKKVSAASQPEGAATDVILTNSRFPARILKATICCPRTMPRLALSAASSRLGPRLYIDKTVDSEGQLQALGPPPCSKFRRKLDPDRIDRGNVLSIRT